MLRFAVKTISATHDQVIIREEPGGRTNDSRVQVPKLALYPIERLGSPNGLFHLPVDRVQTLFDSRELTKRKKATALKRSPFSCHCRLVSQRHCFGLAEERFGTPVESKQLPGLADFS